MPRLNPLRLHVLQAVYVQAMRVMGDEQDRLWKAYVSARTDTNYKRGQVAYQQMQETRLQLRQAFDARHDLLDLP